MTSQEHIDKLRALLEKSKQNVIAQAMVPAANELLAEIKNRVQVDGKKTDVSQIGNYSTRADYFSRQQFVVKGAFRSIGKTGKKTKSTMFLPAGYKEFRSIQGRPTEKINETLSGDTILAYQQQVNQNEILQGFTTTKSSNIRKGQEKRFGSIFKPSQQEVNFYKENVNKTIQQLNLDAIR